MRICVNTGDYQGTQALFVVNSVTLHLTACKINVFFLLLLFKIHTMCVGGGKLYSAGSDQAIISWNLENLTLHKKVEVCYIS